MKRQIKTHIAILLISLNLIGCNVQTVNPTIVINDDNEILYDGKKMSPESICKNISANYSDEIRINLFVSKLAQLQKVAELKNELLKLNLKNINYSAISNINSKFNLNGKWIVKSMVNSSIYALEKEERYLNQTLEIKHSQITELTNLSILKNLQKDIPVVTKSNIDINSEQFVSEYRFDISELNTKNDIICKIETNLKDHPLSTVLSTHPNELIISWDGLYLKLIRLC